MKFLPSGYIRFHGIKAASVLSTVNLAWAHHNIGCLNFSLIQVKTLRNIIDSAVPRNSVTLFLTE